MKNVFHRTLLLVAFWVAAFSINAQRCETTQNVEIGASVYSGTPTVLTFTLHNYNEEQVTVVALYSLVADNGEQLETKRTYVIKADAERSEKFKASDIFSSSSCFDAKMCGASLQVTICK